MVDEKIVIILLLAWVVFGIVLAVIDSKREVNKMRIEKDARNDTKVSVLTKAINEKWHTADDLPKFFGTDILVADYRKSHPHITLERYDDDLKKWFNEHPTAIWCCVYDLLPNYEASF